MSKYKWIIILAILIIFNTVTVFGESNNIQVTINDENINVRKVPVIFDGEELKTEVPSFIHSRRTLVHLRFLENYGAEISWNQSTKTATVEYEGNIMLLTIDSPYVNVNGELKLLDDSSIPKFVKYSDRDNAWTMVPFRFITEIFGFEVGYDEELGVPFMKSKEVVEEPIEPVEEPMDPVEKPIEDPDDVDSIATITNISIGKGSTDKHKVVINSSNKIRYTSEVLAKSNKLVIDIDNAKLDIKGSWDKPGKLIVEDDNFRSVEYSQYSIEPDVVRIVISMTDSLDYDIVPSSDNTRNVISFVNKIDDFRIENIDGKDLILIEGGDKIEYNIMRLKNPERIVIDMMDASLSHGTYHEFKYELGFIKGLRVSQFQADNNYSSLDSIVRVVLDIRDGMSDPLIKIDNVDNTLLIYPEKSLWENMIYERDGKDSLLTIDNKMPTEYLIENYPERKTLEIRVPSSLSELEEGHVYIRDGLIDEVEVVKELKETVILLKYNKSIVFEVLSQDIDSNIMLKINRNLDVKPSDRLIVIDPGHGGSDPGAISITGKHEKDLNFDVANMLNDALIELGYNVLMTRYDDSALGIYERPKIANEYNADVFISIHGNSFPGNRAINGLEVYYWPANRSEIKEEDQYPFAKSIYDELIKATGAGTRGVKTNPYVVIRETKMPAVLIETGFLSNADEEKLLYTKEYQHKLAEGLVKGIESYFEIY